MDPRIIEDLIAKFVQNANPEIRTLTLVITKKQNGRLRVEARESSSHGSRSVSGRRKRPGVEGDVEVDERNESRGDRVEEKEGIDDDKQENNETGGGEGANNNNNTKDDASSVPPRSATSSAAARARELLESQVRRPSTYALAEHRRLALALYQRKLVNEDGTPTFNSYADVEQLKSRGVIEAIRKEVGTRSFSQIETFLRDMTVEGKKVAAAAAASALPPRVLPANSINATNTKGNEESRKSSSTIPLRKSATAEPHGNTNGLKRESSGLALATNENETKKMRSAPNEEDARRHRRAAAAKLASRGGFDLVGCGLDLVRNEGDEGTPPVRMHAVVASYDSTSGRHLLVFDNEEFVWALLEQDVSLQLRELPGEIKIPQATTEMLNAMSDFISPNQHFEDDRDDDGEWKRSAGDVGLEEEDMAVIPNKAS